MKLLGKYEMSFPENSEEAKEWKPIVVRTALHQNVLCVARTRVEGAWSAYCKSVPGFDHSSEYELVLVNGDKLPEVLARVMFPVFEGIPYAL